MAGKSHLFLPSLTRIELWLMLVRFGRCKVTCRYHLLVLVLLCPIETWLCFFRLNAAVCATVKSSLLQRGLFGLRSWLYIPAQKPIFERKTENTTRLEQPAVYSRYSKPFLFFRPDNNYISTMLGAGALVIQKLFWPKKSMPSCLSIDNRTPRWCIRLSSSLVWVSSVSSNPPERILV